MITLLLKSEEVETLNKVVLALGSNLGDSLALLRDAVRLLTADNQLKLTEASSFYKTAPVGYEAQSDFINAVIVCDTTLSPQGLLSLCQEVEAKLNRVRLIRWGPRTIDVDILLYNTEHIDEANLTVPHPRMTERAFVMFPLMEIMPELIIEGKTIQSICEGLADQEIRKMTHEKW